jgi:Tfp pilus assembly protein FimT
MRDLFQSSAIKSGILFLRGVPRDAKKERGALTIIGCRISKAGVDKFYGKANSPKIRQLKASNPGAIKTTNPVRKITAAQDSAADVSAQWVYPEKFSMRSIPVSRLHQQTGFSLVELSVTLALIMALSGFAVLNITAILPGMQANEAMYQAVAQLRRGRESAIAQRRNVELRFQGNNQIQLVRRDVPTGTTILSTVQLANKNQFQLFGDVPDSPDSFGRSASVYFAGSETLTFQTDGVLVNNQGNPINGSIFLGLPGHPETARSVTILGATGRVRSYRWTGCSWIQ